MSELASEMRVQTYITLLSTLSLARAAGRPSEQLEVLSRSSWGRLRELERYRIDATVRSVRDAKLSHEHRKVTREAAA